MRKDDDDGDTAETPPQDQEGDPAEADDGDWLEESDDEYSSLPTGKAELMASKDTCKVQNKLYDEGYREGIGEGKESAVQLGFDAAYNKTGAPTGRQYGFLLGSITALDQYATRNPQSKDDQDAAEKIQSLLSQVRALQVSDLIEPDWEALEHEREHGADVSHIKWETEEQRHKRLHLLEGLQRSVDELSRSHLL